MDKKVTVASLLVGGILLTGGVGCSTTMTSQTAGETPAASAPTDSRTTASADVMTGPTGSTANNPSKPIAGANADIRAQVEASYSKLADVVATGDKKTVLSVLDPDKKSPEPSDDDWKKMVPFLKTTYPKLSTTKFLSIEQKSDTTVYYYFLSDLDDKAYTSVNIYTFNNVNGEWQLSNKLYGSGFATNADKAKQEAAIAKAKADLRIKADKQE